MRIQYKGTKLEQVLQEAERIQFVFCDEQEFAEMLLEAKIKKLEPKQGFAWFSIGRITFYLEEGDER